MLGVYNARLFIIQANMIICYSVSVYTIPYSGNARVDVWQIAEIKVVGEKSLASG